MCALVMLCLGLMGHVGALLLGLRIVAGSGITNLGRLTLNVTVRKELLQSMLSPCSLLSLVVSVSPGVTHGRRRLVLNLP